MPGTQLIVLDGLPGAGKTTNGQWLARYMGEHGQTVSFLAEFDTAHPLWWYDYWDGNDYHPPEYHNNPIESFLSNSLDRWREFTATKQTTPGSVVVAESLFFQDAVSMFLMGDAAPETLKAYAHTVQRLAQPLNPMLIYFRQPDVSAALQRICTIRGSDFQQELVANMESFPYLKHRRLTGLAGIAQLWQAIQALTDSLYAEYKLPKIAIDTSAEAWAQYRQEMLQFIQPGHGWINV